MKRLRRLEARIVWWLLIRMSRRWASRHMDQFESVSFETTHGRAYLSLTLSPVYPDGFEPVDKNGNAVRRR